MIAQIFVGVGLTKQANTKNEPFFCFLFTATIIDLWLLYQFSSYISQDQQTGQIFFRYGYHAGKDGLLLPTACVFICVALYKEVFLTQNTSLWDYFLGIS